MRIITSGGLQGIANSDGEVLIPPIYEHLGWSDGQNNITDEAIGYRENGKWGLINIKNKKITGTRYVVLKPFHEDIIEAGILGRFSNFIFRGLIDSSAKTLLEFRYFSLEYVGDHRLIVSEYKESTFRYGLYTDTNERVIPTEYTSARRLGNLILVTNAEKKIRIFDLNGNQIRQEWLDRVSLGEEGLLIENEGFYGLLSEEGKEIYPLTYKQITRSGNVRFPEWEVVSLKDNSQKTFLGDSIVYHEESDLLIVHVNDTEHILKISKTLFADQQHKLKYLGNGFIVTENAALDEWGIYKTNGTNFVAGVDSVSIDSLYFFTKSDNEWNIYNFFGRKLSKWPFQAIRFSQEGNIPVKKNEYWGWLDFQGERIIDYKFDEVIATANEQQFIAKYLDKWGVYTFNDNWLIIPQYDSIYAYGDFYVAKKGNASDIINRKGNVIDKTAYQLKPSSFLKLKEGNKVGAITTKGIIIDPVFDQISLVDGYLKLRDGNYVTLSDQEGHIIVKPSDKIQDVIAFSEGYFHILKDGKHGFVDENGKLRVANRYDGALPYSEGLAPVKLLGKWGFINKAERLVIQPYYKNSSTFINDLAVVQAGENYGIINKAGNEVVKPAWKNIERLATGNYLITDWSNQVGLVNEKGRFIVRPSYDAIEDTGEGFIIATKADKMGVLDYSGYKKVDFEYKEIRIRGDYMLLLRAQ